MLKYYCGFIEIHFVITRSSVRSGSERFVRIRNPVFKTWSDPDPGLKASMILTFLSKEKSKMSIIFDKNWEEPGSGFFYDSRIRIRVFSEFGSGFLS